ncbi:MAG: sn-glycerol-3-phosphate ABC transporter ATP-binding protein UgpC [Alphaproteobacteria bacterium]|nr:sn-glycerol-3-phosphate ABC transporter ATP-binding protein UgpC [Alphaproteobacteria bacterium]
MAQIRLNHVTKKWNDFIAVDDFHLDINDKEFLVLLGPSGCGKTTTMRMVAGLETPSTGEIWIGDRLVNNIAPKDRDVAMVFQGYGLYPNMSVYENVRFPLKVRKIDESTQHTRVMRAIDMVELEPFLKRKPAELSGGQRQRVALARAIVREPTVFLMDEPLSNLDAKLRVSTRAQIKNLQYELATTTIYVTHDQVEAMTLADRVVVMNQGVIQQIGAPTDIYDKPQNTFVAGFVGAPAMNLVEGEIKNGTFSADNISVKGLKAIDGLVTLGFRAEDAILGAVGKGGGKGGDSIVAPIYTVEQLGDAIMLTLKVGNSLVSVKTAKDVKVKIGEQVKISVPNKICHLFDRQTGAKIII